MKRYMRFSFYLPELNPEAYSICLPMNRSITATLVKYDAKLANIRKSTKYFWKNFNKSGCEMRFW